MFIRFFGVVFSCSKKQPQVSWVQQVICLALSNELGKWSIILHNFNNFHGSYLSYQVDLDLGQYHMPGTIFFDQGCSFEGDVLRQKRQKILPLSISYCHGTICLFSLLCLLSKVSQNKVARNDDRIYFTHRPAVWLELCSTPC